MAFKQGSEFHSYEDFKLALNNFEQATFATYIIKNSDKVENVNIRRRFKVPERFVVSRAHYICNHFGSKRGTSKSKTIKLGCEAEFLVNYNCVKQCLFIKKFNATHNHPTTSETLMREPKSKALNASQKEALKDIVQEFGPSNVDLQNLISDWYNKELTLTDVRTLKHRLKRSASMCTSQTLPNVTATSGEGIQKFETDQEDVKWLVDHDLENSLNCAGPDLKQKAMSCDCSNKRKGDAEHVGVEEVARAKWICLNKITYKDPHGTERIWEGVSRTTKSVGEADAVGMIAMFHDPLTDLKSVILVRQYRPPMQAYTIEFPAGLIDKKETASEAAVREMKEETGYDVTVSHVSPATSLDPGVGSATLKLITCNVNTKNLSRSERPKPTGGDADEFVQVLVEPMYSLMDKLKEFAADGDCVDSRVYTWALALNPTH